jgi:hypothetical protein
VLERRAGGHQRGGSQDSAVVGFDNALIHVVGEAEIVGVHH